jgi:hypothetical protein
MIWSRELISMSTGNRTRKWIVVIVAYLMYVIMRLAPLQTAN